jgi:hypothetical protein
MRSYELDALANLGRDDVVVIERRDEPVTKLAELETLIPI